jgi:hypothetical protein
VSDRQNEVLNAIDATLSGYTDSDPVSSDAMRWSPREDEEQTIEVEGGAKVTFFSDGYSILDEHLYVEATGHLYPHPPTRPTDRFSFTRAAGSDSPEPATVYWVPEIANADAPTAAELRRGIDLTASLHTAQEWVTAFEAVNASMTMPAIEFAELIAAVGGISANEAVRNLMALTDAFMTEAAVPLTGDDFRRRALEARQNRGTGPAERRQRPPRNHGPRRRQ